MTEQVLINKILPNPEQPRKQFDEIALSDLAASIRENGIIQPLVVEEARNGNYILHDGERRFRAAKMAGLDMVPVIITPPLNGTGKQDRLVRAMVANIQREDLNPIEEARAFKRMMEELGMSSERIAIQLGTNSARVYKRLKLLKMDKEITFLIETRGLAHDERLMDALQSLPDKSTRVKVANKIIEKRMNIPTALGLITHLQLRMAEDHLGEDEVPAIQLAVRKSGSPNKAIWDAFSSVGKLPPWILFEISVRDTCKGCSLREMASETCCKDCPMVYLVKTMIGTTK
jgi:ParB family transcriptional regulator, chromosome partitioning protein